MGAPAALSCCRTVPFGLKPPSLFAMCETVCLRASSSFLIFNGLNFHHSTADVALFKFLTSPVERAAIPFPFVKVA